MKIDYSLASLDVRKAKGCTVHIDRETMHKIEKYQNYIRERYPEMPVPTKGQIVRSSVTHWYKALTGVWL